MESEPGKLRVTFRFRAAAAEDGFEFEKGSPAVDVVEVASSGRGA